MVPNGAQDSGVVQPAPAPATKSKKNKKRKNKNGNSKANGDASTQNGNGHVLDSENANPDQDNGASDDELDSPQVEESSDLSRAHVESGIPMTNGSHSEGVDKDTSNGTVNGRSLLELTEPPTSAKDGIQDPMKQDALSDTEKRLDAAAKERDQLRDEVIELRKSLESIQQRHDTSQQHHAKEVTSLNEIVQAKEQKHKEEVADFNAQLEDAQKRYENETSGGNTRLEETRRQHEEQMNAVNRRLEEHQMSHEKDVNTTNSQFEDVRKGYEEQLADLKSQLEGSQKQQAEELKDSAAKLQEVQKTHDEELSAARAELASSQRRHEEGLSSSKARLEEIQKTHEEELSTARGELESSQRSHEEEVSAANSKVEVLQNRHDEELKDLHAKLEENKKNHEEQLIAVNTKLRESQNQRKSDVSSVATRLEDAQKRYDEEVAGFNARLEEVQQRHEDELANVNARLEETQTGKDHAESQYQKLLGKVNTIKTQLGERLKADAADLLQARARIEELEEQNRTVTENNEALQSQIADLTSEKEQQVEEAANLRTRANLSQQNWAKERDDLFTREAQLREEFESAKQAMQDWEVLAMEERSVREGLGDRVVELEEQLSNQREAFERAASERDTQSITVDGLQRALHDIQEARKIELREMVENTQNQLEELRKQLKVAEESAAASQNELETAREELEKALPFEKEVKEKNLLIGKLRHEAVILNDHLTKALRFLKRAKPEDTVDRQLVTNHFLQFLALDRSDPKKFQILQLISAILSWNEEQNESAGLARPGASAQPINPNSSLRVPLSPFLRRVSSNAALNPPMNLNSIFTSPNSSTPLSPMAEGGLESPPVGSKESLAELWSGFLERESAVRNGESGRRDTAVVSPTSGTSTPRYGGYGLGPGSRRPSVSGGAGSS